jgi:hypothetical protein
MVKGGGGEGKCMGGEGGGGVVAVHKLRSVWGIYCSLRGRGTFIMAEVGGGAFLVTIYLLRVKKGG